MNNKILELQLLLKLGRLNQLAEKCLLSIESHTFLYKEYSTPFKTKAYLEILQKRNSSLKMREVKIGINGLEDLIDKLAEYQDTSLSVVNIAADKNVYTICLSNGLNNLIGLFVKEDVIIDELISLEKDYLSRGLKIDRWITSPPLPAGTPPAEN